MWDSLQLFFAASQGGIGDLVEGVVERFGLNLPLLVSNMISFLIVAFLLHRFAYKPVLEVLAQRRAAIEEGLKNAERIKQQLQETEAKRQEILAEAQKKAEAIIGEARRSAQELLDRETKRAMAAAEEILERAREAGRIEMARMRMELRREMGRLIVETAAKVTQKMLTDEEHQRLIREAELELEGKK